MCDLCYVTNASFCSSPGGFSWSRTHCTGSAGSVCRMRRTLPTRSCTAALWWSVEEEPDTSMRHPGCRSPQRQSGPLASSQHPECRQRHLSRDSPREEVPRNMSVSQLARNDGGEVEVRLVAILSGRPVAHEVTGCDVGVGCSDVTKYRLRCAHIPAGSCRVQSDMEQNDVVPLVV